MLPGIRKYNGRDRTTARCPGTDAWGTSDSLRVIVVFAVETDSATVQAMKLLPAAENVIEF